MVNTQFLGNEEKINDAYELLIGSFRVDDEVKNILKEKSFLEQNPLNSAVYTNALVVKDNNEPAGIFNNTQPTIFDINYLLQRGNFLNHSSMLYRECFKSNIINLEAPFIDYKINLHHALEGLIGYINQALTVYRLNSSSSVLVQSNDRIRRLYWKTILDIPKTSINTKVLASCISEFTRSVFFRSIITRKPSLYRQWLPIVLKASPVGKTRMFLLGKLVENLVSHSI